jgi:hypothetical protein
VGGLFSVAVSWGTGPSAVSTRGIVDYHDLVQFDEDNTARVIGRERGVTLQTNVIASAATPLVPGTSMTVDGGSYTMREKLALEDGATTLVYLRG